MKKLSMFFTMFFMVTMLAFAQKTVTGNISDERGESLIGANILVKGTNTGTITDFDGNFTIDVPEGSTILQISYTGFTTMEIDVTGTNRVDATLSADVIGLDDVIVVGYGSSKRKDISGAVSSVSSEDIRGESNITLESALRGRAAGVQVFQASGTPGSAMNVRVRGSSSINASNQPLYIIDGVPLISGDFAQVGVGGQSLNALADINPTDIESIEVLKDAATAAIYGNRAANGVVLITTKKGKAGRTQFNFDGSYGFQEAANLVQLINAEQYMEQMDVLYGSPTAIAGGLGGTTDWYNEIFHRSNVSNYSLNASGGDEKTRFYGGLTYSDNQGIVKGSQFERYSGRLNVEHFASDKISLGINMGYNYSKNKRI